MTNLKWRIRNKKNVEKLMHAKTVQHEQEVHKHIKTGTTYSRLDIQQERFSDLSVGGAEIVNQPNFRVLNLHMEAFRISWVDRKHTSIDHANCSFHCRINKVTRHFVQRPATQNPTSRRNKDTARTDLRNVECSIQLRIGKAACIDVLFS